jgi:hypothetical protein
VKRMVIDYDELEIVGFDGRTRVPCARALPVVRNRHTNLFFKLSIRTQESRSINYFSHSEIEAFAREGRLTLLPRPSEAFENAMLIYVKRELLDAAKVSLPVSLPWQDLDDNAWAACAPESEVNKLADGLGEALMARSTERLRSFFANGDEGDRGESERLARMALNAAVSETLRARVHIRYGVAARFSSSPERLDNIFDLIIAREFPTWTWESFLERLDRFASLLGGRKAKAAGASAEEAVDLPLGLPDDPAHITPELICEISRRIMTDIQDHKEQLDACTEIARQFRVDYPTEPGKIEFVAEWLFHYGALTVDAQMLKVLVGEPVIFYQNMFDGKGGDKGYSLNVMSYLDATSVFKNNGVDPGELANALFKMRAAAKAVGTQQMRG